MIAFSKLALKLKGQLVIVFILFYLTGYLQ